MNLPLLLAIEAVNTEVEGGLFDFNATLPLMILQFIALTVILNFLFYRPVTDILDERDEYIRNTLTAASASLLKADELVQKYEKELAESRKQAQDIIKKSQQEAQDLVSIKIQEAQRNTDKLVVEASIQLNVQKEQALSALESQIETLSKQIKLKLLDKELLI